LEVQICLAGAPLLPNITKEIFLCMINIPFWGTSRLPLQIELRCIKPERKQNAFGAHSPKGVTNTEIR
jgi:hypothetical protein